MNKKYFFIFALLVIIAVLFGFYFSIEKSTKQAVKEYIESATGFETDIKGFEVDFLKGYIRIDEINLANLDKYKNENFAIFSGVYIKFDLVGLLSSIPYVDEVTIEKTIFYIEPISIVHNNLYEAIEKVSNIVVENKGKEFIIYEIKFGDIHVDVKYIKDEKNIEDFKIVEKSLGKIEGEYPKKLIKETFEKILKEINNKISNKDIDYKSLANKNLSLALDDIKEKMKDKGVFSKMEQ